MMIENMCPPMYHQSERLVLCPFFSVAILHVELYSVLTSIHKSSNSFHCIQGYMSLDPINLKGGILCILLSSKKCIAESLPCPSVKVMLQRKSLIIGILWPLVQHSLHQTPFMVFRTSLCLQKVKGRWSMVIGIFVILRFLRGRHSSPHLVRSDPIDQGTIVTSPSAPLSPLLSPLTCVAIDLPNHKTILLDTGLPSQYVFNLLEKALHHTTHWSSGPRKD